jgi:hypothetical protein
MRPAKEVNDLSIPPPQQQQDKRGKKKAPAKGSTRCLCLWFFSFPFRCFFFVSFLSDSFLEQEELG